MRLKGELHDTVIFGCYVPHNWRHKAPYQKEILQILSDAVRDSVKQGSRRDCIIVAGDLNVRLARGHEYQTASGQQRKVTGQYTPAYKSSEGGEKVLNMCEELGLVVANTMFKPARQREKCR